MAKQGIVTTAQDAITDAAKAGVSSVTSVAGAARKAATGAILRTVKRARAAVNSDLPKRKKKAGKKSARKAAKKAVRKSASKSARKKSARKPVKKSARKTKRVARKK